MKNCIIIGDPVSHSLSPKMHNAAYAYLKIDHEYQFSSLKVTKSDLKSTLEDLKRKEVRGVTCTYPLKEVVLEYLDVLDETAEKIGAVNTIVNLEGTLKGYNTDWYGVVEPFKQQRPVKSARVAIIGTGGAAKAACYGIAREGGIPVVFGRNSIEGELLAGKFGGEYRLLEQLPQISSINFIFNATPLGMAPDNINITPVPSGLLHKEMIVFDSVYNPRETLLLKSAKEAGCKVVGGIEMLLFQGIKQFELYTGNAAPVDVMRKELSL